MDGNWPSRSEPAIREPAHLFMSGYTSDVIAHHGILEEGLNFIQKPFSATDFAVKVREVLGEMPESDR